jgi:hypothetical protein
MSDELDEVEPGVSAVLLGLYQRDGELTAETVVAEARNRRSRLHRHFEWDDGAAATQWRLHQARLLINHCMVSIMEQPVREFVHLPSQGSYAPIRDAMANTDWRREFLDRFEADARAFEARWSTHKWVSDAYVKWLRRQARKAS